MSGRALVTGATSGIGAAFAGELAARGWSVVAVGRSPAALDALAGGLPGLTPLAADLATDAGLDAVTGEIARRPVDLLVNNAATGRWGAFGEEPVDTVETTLAVNVRAPTRLAHAALPAMIGAGRGGIVTVSSGSGRGPAPMLAVYGATKSYLDALDASLRGELDRLRIRGVTITTVRPGRVRTRLPERMGDPAVDAVHARRWIEPAAVARAALDAHARGRDTVTVPRPRIDERLRGTARAAVYRFPAPTRRTVRALVGR